MGRLFFLLLTLACFCAPRWIAPAFAASSDPAGEAFGKPVTQAEFLQHYKTASILSRSGKERPGEEEIRQEAWQNLVFLREADRLGIKVKRPEVEEELKRLLGQKGVEYGTEKYRAWVRLNFGEETALFERRMEQLLRINRLIRSKTDLPVEVTDGEIARKFLDQYHSIESEYIHFDSAEEAQGFLERLKRDPGIWRETYDQRKSQMGQRGAAWINIMSLEALIDLWKIPREDVYRLLEIKEGEFLVAKNYYGDCLFRLLYKRKASLEDLDEKKRQDYRKMLTAMKRHEAAQAYFSDLIQRAGIRDYQQEGKQMEEKARQAGKAEELKKKGRIRLKTSRGDVELRIFPEKAPKACENFIGLVEKGYYNGLLFHRVKKGFMIQGGDPTATGTGGESIWGKPFEDELSDGLSFDRPGLLGMANSGPNTNGSQFFITTVPTPWLNGKHTIFGEVVSGMEVVKAMEASPTDSQDKPLEAQKILHASILQEEKP